MTLMIRRALMVAVVIVTAAAFHLWVITPYQCNRIVRRATDTLRVMESSGNASLRQAELARRNVEFLQPCLRNCPSNVAAAMDLAASYRYLGLQASAVEMYEHALKFERRPELYYNLGETQLEMGATADAIRNFTTACLYNPGYLNILPAHYAEVKSAVERYQTELASRAGQSP